LVAGYFTLARAMASVWVAGTAVDGTDDFGGVGSGSSTSGFFGDDSGSSKGGLASFTGGGRGGTGACVVPWPGMATAQSPLRGWLR
jgi:hypothetical protein